MAKRTTPRKRLRSRRTPPRARTRTEERSEVPSARGYETPVKVMASSAGGVGAVYLVQPGDTTEQICRRFGITLEQLARANPESRDINRIFTGQILEIPFLASTLPAVSGVTMEYVVQPGDSLKVIADRFAVSLTSLRLANPLVTPSKLIPGTVMFVPVVQDPPEPSIRALLYVIQAGDTPDAIASRFSVTRAALVQANPQVPDVRLLVAGVLTVIPVAGVPLVLVFDRIRYVMQPNDTVSGVVRRFEIWEPGLRNLNPLVEAIPGLTIQLPVPVLVAPAPEAPADFPPCHTAPFGQRLVLADDDAVFITAPLGYGFTYYGEEFAGGVWVNSNGSISFTNGDPAFLPDTDAMLAGAPRIAVFWADLVPPAAPGTGGVFVDFLPMPEGIRLDVTWDRVPIFGIDKFHTVQLSLNPDGSIEFCYFHLEPLIVNGSPRVMIGLAPGGDRSGATTFIYDEATNPRRVGDPAENTPSGSLSGRTLLYRFDPATGSYRMTFTP